MRRRRSCLSGSFHGARSGVVTPGEAVSKSRPLYWSVAGARGKGGFEADGDEPEYEGKDQDMGRFLQTMPERCSSPFAVVQEHSGHECASCETLRASNFPGTHDGILERGGMARISIKSTPGSLRDGCRPCRLSDDSWRPRFHDEGPVCSSPGGTASEVSRYRKSGCNPVRFTP